MCRSSAFLAIHIRAPSIQHFWNFDAITARIPNFNQKFDIPDFNHLVHRIEGETRSKVVVPFIPEPELQSSHGTMQDNLSSPITTRFLNVVSSIYLYKGCFLGESSNLENPSILLSNIIPNDIGSIEKMKADGPADNSTSFLVGNIRYGLSMLLQRAKMDWLTNGDQCSAYFFKKIATRRSKSQIFSIDDQNGNEIHDSGLTRDELMRFYTNLLGVSGRDPNSPLPNLKCFVSKQLSHEESNFMIRLVDMEEIKRVMFSMPDDKDLGPDGFTAAFMVDCWARNLRSWCSRSQGLDLPSEKILGLAFEHATLCKTPSYIGFNREMVQIKLIKNFMDKTWIDSSDTLSAQYILGVANFLEFAFTAKLDGSRIYCPCTKCKNRFTKKREVVREHCLLYGFEKSNKSVDLLLELLKDSFPDGANLPANYHEAQKITNDLGFTYETIDACPNNCMLFRGNDSGIDRCEIYERIDDGKFRHSADALAWKDFDMKNPSFASDARNIKMGLAADGVNPFRMMNISHSTWPVVRKPKALMLVLIVIEMEIKKASTLNVDLLNELDGVAIDYKKEDLRKRRKAEYEKETVRRTLPKNVVDAIIERYFPPSFFNIMEHLSVHLADEALKGGLVQFRWMHPIERYLMTLKRYVRNRAFPEGSIARGYLMDECMNFSSRYLNDVETKENRQPRNYVGDESIVEPYCNMHVAKIARENPRDRRPHAGEVFYYGVVTDIIKVRYTNDLKFVMFKCDLVDPGKGVKQDEYKFTLVNFKHLLYKNNMSTDEPFILSSQADQDWYVPDPLQVDWKVVVTMTPRDNIDVYSRSQAESFRYQGLDDHIPTCDVDVGWTRQGVDGIVVDENDDDHEIGRKKPRGTAMEDVVRQMITITDGASSPNTSNMSKQPQNHLIPRSQSNFNAQSQPNLLHESQRNNSGTGSKLPVSKKSNPSMEKKGRGPAKLPYKWGSETKDNTTLSLKAKSAVLHQLNDMWRDWKRRLKANYFTPYKDDPNHDFSELPNEQMRYEGVNTTEFDMFIASRSCRKGIDADSETTNLVVSV
ncbi:hypothetical protein BUALT_Bualt11G0035900 [Buddleja alternifolia]|uniref:Transposase n=1 Tax=Buddleja alternifolia TaxID=168488 RepID=A0AAV6X0S0_9LAMI|nr:hypothetical protein BUALT_Bualt11G0035900 [Buddleja alternifolia]